MLWDYRKWKNTKDAVNAEEHRGTLTAVNDCYLKNNEVNKHTLGNKKKEEKTKPKATRRGKG